MRLVVHDFAGHPFQAQLSRALARRGHDVLHLSAGGLPGPKGAIERLPDDPLSLEIEPVTISRPFPKYDLVARLRNQREYSKRLNQRILRFRPDAVLSANTPTDVQYSVLQAAHREDIAVLHWMQDLYGEALRTVFRRKLGVFGPALSRPFFWLERRICENCETVICIAPEFENYLSRHNIRPQRCCVLENWASLEETPRLSRDNPWSRQHLPRDASFRFIYSGTLGLKHSPDLLAALASGLSSDCRVIVVSEGWGRDYLQGDRSPVGANSIRFLDFQPHQRVPEVLAAADVLIATIDEEASRFAVPSKVLTYLCAGRPVLLASPSDNLAAGVVREAGAGIVVEPCDVAGFTEAAKRLYSDPELRRELGDNGRRWAERRFDISQISSQFESALIQAVEMRRALPVKGVPGYSNA